MKKVIGYSALALGAAGTIYALTQPNENKNLSLKARRANTIIGLSMLAFGVAGGVLLVGGAESSGA